MCGEHEEPDGFSEAEAGSSPHVRGARGLLLPRGIVLGIIPACAGSTSMKSGIDHDDWDHPRMCGEHAKKTDIPDVSGGSSPHVRGARIVV